jgi:hypothetical protein
MGTLQEVAGLILLQVNHSRECGKDEKFTKDEIADIIHRRVDKKDLMVYVVAQSKKLCPDCGNTGRRLPQTLESPDGQECIH